MASTTTVIATSPIVASSEATKGVFKSGQAFFASVHDQGRTKFLGRFPDEQQAQDSVSSFMAARGLTSLDRQFQSGL